MDRTKRFKYSIGLDLGVASCGWAVYDLNNHKILELPNGYMAGVRTFKQANSAEDRRNARSSRRRLSRRNNRKQDLKKLFERNGHQVKVATNHNLIKLRNEGLNRALTPQELFECMYYYAGKRGYFTFGESANKNEEAMDNIVDNKQLNGKLPCQYELELFNNSEKVRGEITFYHKDVMLEVKKIIANSSIIFGDEIVTILERKREYSKGPGSQKSLTDFGTFKLDGTELKYLWSDKISPCHMFIDKTAASCNSYLYERFIFRTEIANIRFSENNEYVNNQRLTNVAITKIERAMFKNILEGKNLTMAKIIKDELNLSGEEYKKFFEKQKTKEDAIKFPTTRKLSNLLVKWESEEKGKAFKMLNSEDYHQFIEICSQAQTTDELAQILIYEGFHPDFIDYATLLTQTKGYAKYSLDALQVIINDLEIYEKSGHAMNFSELSNFSVDFKEKYEDKIFANRLENYSTSGKIEINQKAINEFIINPQAKRSLRQALLIVNAIIKKMSQMSGFENFVPDAIVLEAATELNDATRKKEIEQEQEVNTKIRESAKKEIEAMGFEATETKILKYRLWKEAQEKCTYCGEPIPRDQVLGNSFGMQVDHILPFSKTADDSYSNKVCSCASCNAAKGNTTPYSYMSSIGNFEIWSKKISAKTLKISDAKREKLLNQIDINKYSKRFINRNLTDTAYAIKQLKSELQLWNNANEFEIDIVTLPAVFTAKTRVKFNLPKDRETFHHHAVDAAIIAAMHDTKLGKHINYVQNNDAFWKLSNENNIVNDIFEKDNDKKDNLFGALVLSKNALAQLKNINECNIHYSRKIDHSSTAKLSDADLCKYVKTTSKKSNNEVYRKVRKWTNIYAPIEKSADIKKYSEMINNVHGTYSLTIFSEFNGANTYLQDTLKYAWNTYEKDISTYEISTFIDDKHVTMKPKNPFVIFLLEEGELNKKTFLIEKNKNNSFWNKNGIRSSKNINSPKVINLNYLEGEKKTFATFKTPKINTSSLISYDKKAQAFIEVWDDKKNEKLVFIPVLIGDVLNNNVNSESENYTFWIKKNLATNSFNNINRDRFIFKERLFTGDLLYVNNALLSVENLNISTNLLLVSTIIGKKYTTLPKTISYHKCNQSLLGNIFSKL